MINAIVLANTQQEMNWNGVENRALLRINGKAMVEYVLDALKGCPGIGKVVLQGGGSDLAALFSSKVDVIVESKGTLTGDLKECVKCLDSLEGFLVCTSDIPMVTPAAINEFIEKALSSGAGLCYPIIDKRENDLKYPEMERTYVRTKEGSFTGGCIVYVTPQILEKVLMLAERLMRCGKKPLRMARMLGFGIYLRLLLGTLTLDAVENRLSSILGTQAKIVVSSYPEIGNNVSKASDLIVATAHLSR